jgi:uncharacterized protein
VIGGLLAVEVPAAVLRVLMAAVIAVALSRLVFRWTARLPASALAPAGAAVGALTATAGGAGVLVAPLLLASGVEGDRYLATMAFIAAAMHVGRIVGYGAGGLIDGGMVAVAAALAVALVAGNLLGQAVRGKLDPAARRRVEYATLVVCAALAMA